MHVHVYIHVHVQAHQQLIAVYMYVHVHDSLREFKTALQYGCFILYNKILCTHKLYHDNEPGVGRQ